MRTRDRELLPALAHELGNLLAAIRLSAHLAPHEREARERERGARQIEALAAEAGELAALLRPLTGERRGRVLEVDAGRALEAARGAFGDGPEASRVELRPSPRPLRVRADPDALHHALAALVRAAVAASAPEGTVLVSSRRRGATALLEIADAGRVQRGRALRVELADAVLGRSGGRVVATATRAGTRVRVELPLATPPGAPARARAGRPARPRAAGAGPRPGRPPRGRAARSR